MICKTSTSHSSLRSSTVSKVPSDLQGIAYAALVSNVTDDIDKYLLSTYVVVDFTFDSYANNSGPSFD